MLNTTKNLLLLLLLTAVTACGWHLRGSQTLPLDFERVALTGVSGALRTELEDQLAASGVVVSTSEPQFTLAFANERQSRRTAALSADAVAAEYEFNQSVDFEVFAADGSLLGQDSAQLTRSVSFDPDQVLGSANEAQLVQREMARELATQIIRKLNYLAGQKAHGQTAP